MDCDVRLYNVDHLAPLQQQLVGVYIQTILHSIGYYTECGCNAIWYVLKYILYFKSVVPTYLPI